MSCSKVVSTRRSTVLSLPFLVRLSWAGQWTLLTRTKKWKTDHKLVLLRMTRNDRFDDNPTFPESLSSGIFIRFIFLEFSGTV